MCISTDCVAEEILLEEVSLRGYISIINALIGAIEGSTAILLLDYDGDRFSLLEEVLEHDFLKFSTTSIGYGSESL